MHQILVRTTAVVALLFWWAAAHAQGEPPSRGEATWVSPGQQTGIRILNGSPPGDEPARQHCRANNPSGCNLTITVTVDVNDATGKACTFSGFPVVVVKGDSMKLTWTLEEKVSNEDARFVDDNGGEDGIRIHQKTGSERYGSRKRISKVQHAWTRSDPNVDDARVLFYDVNVEHTRDGKVLRCTPPDPIIVNRD